MEEDKKPPINEEYIMSMVSDTDSGKGIVLPADKVQVRKQPEKVIPKSNPAETAETTDEVPKEKPEIEERKEVKRKKQSSVSQDYDAVFIKPGELNVRNGKAIYIRADFHKTIARIVQTIGGGKVSLTDYVDNVFAHHFRHYEQEIKESFNKNNEPIL